MELTQEYVTDYVLLFVVFKPLHFWSEDHFYSRLNW